MKLALNHNPGLVQIVNEKIKQNICVCEVGVYQGETTIVYAPIVKEYGGSIILVDWFQGNVDGIGVHSYNPNNKNNVRQNLEDNLREIDCLDIVTILEGISWEVGKNILDNSLDICFVDADHRYSSVLKDLEVFYSKVKVGGFICGDDLENIELANTFTEEQLEADYIFPASNTKGRNCMHPGVIQAVHDIIGSDIVEYPNWTWLKEKK